MSRVQPLLASDFEPITCFFWLLLLSDRVVTVRIKEENGV